MSAVKPDLCGENMYRIANIVLVVFLTLIPQSASRSQLPPLDFNLIEKSSVYVVLGRVNNFRFVEGNERNGKKYEVSVQIVSHLKGSPTINSIVIPVKIGGLRGFDFYLEKGDLGVFFLKAIEGNRGTLVYPGSIATFKKEYFIK